MHLNKLQNKMLQSMYKSNRILDSFTLFKRMKISFSEFSHAINKLISENLIEEKGHELRVTLKGAQYVLSIGSVENANKTWREVPEKLQIERLKANDFYIPSSKLLDDNTFNSDEDNVD